MHRNNFCKLIMAILCLGLFFVCPLRAQAVTQISTLAELQAMSSNLTGSYELVNDIDASETSTWNSGAGFVPIGTSSTKFTGSFNGNGHVISNLYISRSTTNFCGLFGFSSGSISAVGLTNATVNGKGYTGGLVGNNTGGAITDCWVTGAVTGASTRAGGLAGYNSGGAITQCYSTAAVSGTGTVGGLLGQSTGSITNCYSIGAVSASSSTGYAGGLIGSISSSTTITNCYSTGAVSGTSGYVFGLLGGTSSGTVTNCFWDTETSGQSTSKGGTGKTTAEMMTKSTFTDAGWDFATLWDINDGSSYPFLEPTFYQDADGDGYGNAAVSLRGTSKPDGYVANSTDCDDSDASVHALATYYLDADADGYGDALSSTTVCSLTVPTGYVADSTDCNDSDASAHVLATYCQDADGDGYGNAMVSTTVCSATAPTGYVADCTDGDDSDASNHTIYKISTLAQLQAMNNNLTAPYELVNDIDASDTINWNSGAGFAPISGFSGSFNGNGFVISHLYINRSTTSNVGLFGVLSGSISAVGLTNATVTGQGTVGTLAGYNAGGAITDCWVTNAVVSGASNSVGGLVGQQYSGSMSWCYSTGSVSGPLIVGGLVGANMSNSSITNCYSTAAVIGGANNTFGGLVGYNDSSSITNCYATGSVTGAGYTAGGLVGNNGGPITNCYSTGTVSAKGNAGGFVGVWAAGSITNSFWDTQTSGWSTSVGGTGKTTAEMMTKSTFTDAGWDFAAVWDIVDGSSYPFLVKGFFQDADGDGYGNAEVSIRGNSAPTGYVANNTDCNDTDPSVHALSTYYLDADADGYGDAAVTTSVCSATAPTGYAANSTDCNDTNAAINPGAGEICGNSIDENCDSLLDDNGCSTTVFRVGADWTVGHYTDLQTAINAASAYSGSEIWVEQGMYTLSDTITINGNGISLYGGFTGTETSRDQRSTDASLTIIDGNDSRRCIWTTGTVTIDGFTITRGNTTSDASNGAGLRNGEYNTTAGYLTINNCIFTANHSGKHAGALFNDEGSADITNCTFTGNIGTNRGGAIASFTSTSFSSASRLTVTGCVFTGNYSNHAGGINIGSGSGTNTITDCVFTGNQALMPGSGDGAVILCDGDVTISGCTFKQNTGTRYGVVTGYNDTGSSMKLINCLFTGNTTKYGALCCNGAEGYLGSIEVMNCTFTGNTATSGHGGAIYTRKPYSDSSSVFTVTNSIIWGNTGTAISRSGTDNLLPTVTYSDIDQTDYAGTISNSINSDPLFTDAANGDYTLQSTSPCIDAGMAAGAPAEDILKVSRPQGSGIDMGAYELMGSTLISLSSFDAVPGNRKVTLTWTTESEIDNAGFNIYRAEADGEYVKINEAIIPAEGAATMGASYQFTDTDVQNRASYSYKLEDMDVNGVSTFHGPVSATPRLIYGLTGK